MLARIQVIRSRSLSWPGKAIQLRLPFGSVGGGGGGTRTVPGIVVVLPRLGQGRFLIWRLSHLFVRATFGPPPPPPNTILALAMAADAQINLAMADPNTLFLSMCSQNTLNLVMHGS